MAGSIDLPLDHVDDYLSPAEAFNLATYKRRHPGQLVRVFLLFGQAFAVGADSTGKAL